MLLIAEAANPEWVSVPLVGWSHCAEIAKLTEAHLVTQLRNAAAIRRAGWSDTQFTALDTERIGAPLYRAGEKIRKLTGLGWTVNTAIAGVSYYNFEYKLWAKFGKRIMAGEFDLVHRVTPLSPTTPSPFLAGRCKKAGVPFLWGPINGGVPWPAQFKKVQRAEGEWLSYVRDAYKLLPGYRSTRENASALLIGSQATWEQFEGYHDRAVYIPENAIDPARFPSPVPKFEGGQLRVAFVGRLVPYKGADMLLEAAAPLVREGKVILDIIGDGPEMERLRELRRKLDIEAGVLLDGWVPHHQLQERLLLSHVLGFPSVREFGGGVVLEAMAVGLVPVVVDYAGPRELVTSQTGIRVPLADRTGVIAGVREALTRLQSEPQLTSRLSVNSRKRVLGAFTWQKKAEQTLEVYKWVLGERRKPDFGMPFPEVDH